MAINLTSHAGKISSTAEVSVPTDTMKLSASNHFNYNPHI